MHVGVNKTERKVGQDDFLGFFEFVLHQVDQRRMNFSDGGLVELIKIVL